MVADCDPEFLCKIRCFDKSKSVCRAARTKKDGELFDYDGELVRILWGGVWNCDDEPCHRVLSMSEHEVTFYNAEYEPISVITDHDVAIEA